MLTAFHRQRPMTAQIPTANRQQPFSRVKSRVSVMLRVTSLFSSGCGTLCCKPNVSEIPQGEGGAPSPGLSCAAPQGAAVIRYPQRGPKGPLFHPESALPPERPLSPHGGAAPEGAGSPFTPLRQSVRQTECFRDPKGEGEVWVQVSDPSRFSGQALHMRRSKTCAHTAKC